MLSVFFLNASVLQRKHNAPITRNVVVNILLSVVYYSNSTAHPVDCIIF